MAKTFRVLIFIAPDLKDGVKMTANELVRLEAN